MPVEPHPAHGQKHHGDRNNSRLTVKEVLRHGSGIPDLQVIAGDINRPLAAGALTLGLRNSVLASVHVLVAAGAGTDRRQRGRAELEFPVLYTGIFHLSTLIPHPYTDALEGSRTE